jgi:hypothetical protein
MRTITLVAHNRHVYTAQALNGLALALLKGAELEQEPFDRLIVSIDPSKDGKVDLATEQVCEKMAKLMSEGGLCECTLYTNKVHLGVGGNHLITLQRAFEEHDSDFNLMIEDDAVLTEDAISLANWYWMEHGQPLSDYLLISMCNHRAFGRENNPGGIPNNPSFIVESPYITAPFAWATTRWQWPFIKATWNRKELPPNGWDFSLSFYMRITRKKGIHPILSRCRNIGEFGQNETPESFHRTQDGIIVSDGSYIGNYKVVGTLPHEELQKLDDWMVSEEWRLFPR